MRRLAIGIDIATTLEDYISDYIASLDKGRLKRL